MRIGAYVLAADPTWLRSSLASYYDHLDALVLAIPADGLGWSGVPVQAQRCADIVRQSDHRGIVREVVGRWVDSDDPMRAENRQRNAAIQALGDDVDWVLQIDSDEILPSFAALKGVLEQADRRRINSVEWPMRVLYRQLRDGRFLQVMSRSAQDHFEYPGPIAIRARTPVVQARRTTGGYLRPVIAGDGASLQVCGPAEPEEVRLPGLPSLAAIVHNSWARKPSNVRNKVSSWGHQSDANWRAYYYLTWLPATYSWRFLRDFHPFSRGLWPALAPASIPLDDLLRSEDK